MWTLQEVMGKLGITIVNLGLSHKLMSQGFAFETDGVVVDYNQVKLDIDRVRMQLSEVTAWLNELDAQVRADKHLLLAIEPDCPKNPNPRKG